ncbi:vascular cell adhesion protein 1b [Anguilla rostrata]|uniref:vascular cell adhesion protein 1b n=1 Tax=Anguilla rostrata TaxID=7938 RepID=UPI0030D57646
MEFTIMMILALPVAANSFVMELEPRNTVLRVGDRQVLRCSARDCSESTTLTWASLEDKPLSGSVENPSASESLLIFDPVSTAHDNMFVCKVSCGNKRKQMSATVKVYSFPKEPVISGNGHMLVGEANTLTCKVPTVYPPEYMEIEWLQGGRVLHTYEGRADISNVTSRYKYMATSEDNGKAITCRARHTFEGVPEDQKIKETTVSLNVMYAPRDIRISETAVVKMGANLTLACTAEGNPRPVTVWRKVGPAGQSVTVGENETLVFGHVTVSHAGTYECETKSMLGNLRATVNVTVQGPPRNTSITVSPARELKEGDNVTISCYTDSVPAGRLVLRRVSEGQKTDLQTSSDSTTSISLPSVQLSDSGLYECEALNEHGSQAASTQVTVEVHPLEVELSPGDGVITVERGASVILSCRATGCPSPAFFWKSPLDASVRRRSQTQGPLSQLFLSPVELQDERAYTCEVKCGSVLKSKGTEIKVFSFPSDPVIESGGAHVEGKVSTLRCSVRDVFPAERLRVDWWDEERLLHSEEGSFSSGLQDLTSTLTFTPTAGHQGKRVTCKATFQMEGVPRNRTVRTAVTTVTLQYAPRNTSITVSPARELKEGDNVTISCYTDSVPAGRLVLRRVSEGQKTDLQTSSDSTTSISLPSVQLSDSGLYECEALNEHGSQAASTRVIVKTPPRNTTVQVFPSSQVQEGQNVTICCRTVSFPPPAVILRKLDGGAELYSPNGTFLLLNLTLRDTGLYQVNVTNDLGYETEVFTISVMERQSSPPPSWNDFIVPVIGVAAVVTAVAMTGLAVHYLNQARKRGLYELAKSTPRTV